MDLNQETDCDIPGIYISEFKPQKSIIYNKYLPYADDLHDEVILQLKEIKENLSKAILLRDIRPGCTYWSARLGRFIRLYGMCFSKEDHILFVKLLYELVVIPDQEFIVTEKFAQILSLLLKKRELLSPEDIQLEWKPLYDIFYNFFLSSTRRYGMILLPPNAEYQIKSLIRCCHPYFPLSATSELLEKWRPHFCPFDQSMNKAINILEVFLPTLIAPENSHFGWKLWHEEFLNIWSTFTNEPSWQSYMFCLFARLAWHNIGYIDWEKYLPSIFTRILQKFNLPVTYKNVHLESSNLNNWSISWFIISNLGGNSKTQDYLDQLFKSLESYYHPSNVGCWTRNLQDFLLKLSQYFVQRLHHERYMKPSWKLPTPDWKKLTDDDIDRFVKCLFPATKLAIFSKTGSYDAGTVVHRLALLSPETVIPPLIDQLYLSLETMTEPHRLTASLHCVVRIARPMVLGGSNFSNKEKKYPEGPKHVLPLLMLALPGIDPNDITKCMTTFQFIATFVSLVPLVDCSSAPERIQSLTEIEQDLCLQTEGFGDFVMQFMDRCFALIESSSLEQTTQLDSETETMNLEENMVALGLSSAFKIILTQAHPQIFDEALQRLVSFTKGRCMETKVSGKFVSTMCRAAAKVNSEKTLKAFIPSVTRLILTLTQNPEIQKEENLDNEILFNLLLVSELVQSKGKYLVQYLPVLKEVLMQTLYLNCREGYKLSSIILRNLLWSLSLLHHTNEAKSSTVSWDTPFAEFLPIKHWGEAGKLDSLGMTWSEPGEEEEQALTMLINQFLLPELEILQRVADGDATILRERFHQSLIITQDILFAGAVLPMWDEQTIKLNEMAVERGSSELKTSLVPIEIKLDSPKYPKNIRLAVANTTLKLVDALIDKGSDDTKALNFVVSIYLSLIFFNGVKYEEYEEVLKNFRRVKYSLADSVVRKKQHIRSLLIERVVLQHQRRVLLKGATQFTATHERIMRSLWKLSISQYSEVRRKSQAALGKVFQQFNSSYKLILPDLVDVLNKDSKVFHKEIKGALFVVLSFKKRSLIVRRDWNALSSIWPALLSSEYSEKPSIIKLYDCLLKTMASHFELFAIDIKVSEKAVACARELLSSSLPSVANSSLDISQEKQAIVRLAGKVQENRDVYSSLVHKIAHFVDSGSLHWRRTQLALTMFWLLIRPDIPFPAQGVKTVIHFLINENIILRKIALGCMPWILKNQKRPHKKLTMKTSDLCDVSSTPTALKPGDNRPDNKWLQYSSSSINLTETDWEEGKFLHKTYHGWYSWPREIDIYAPPSNQPPVNREYESLNAGEKAIHDFFKCQKNVDSLISYLSLEEYKGLDKFDQKIFLFHKGLFRNFGNTFLPMFEKHLERLVSDSIESNQRCAAELIAGMMRGSKHWPYKEAMSLMQLVCRLLNIALSKVMNETLTDWGTCLSTICRDRDPNRIAPLMENFLKGLSFEEGGSFLFSSRLVLTQHFLEQQEWRVADSFHEFYDFLKLHFASPYKTIRDNVGTLLYVIFLHDQELQGGVRTRGPRISSLVEYLLPRLSVLIQETGSGGSALEIASSYPSGESTTDGTFGSPSMISSDPSYSIEMSVAHALHSFESPSRPESPKEMQESSRSMDLNQSNPLNINLHSHCGNTSGSKLQIQAMQGGGASSGTGYLPGESEERKTALRLMNTLCKYLRNVAYYGSFSFSKDIFNFLPHLCQIESINSDQELRSNCVISLGCLSSTFIQPDTIGFVLQILQSICQNGWWRARTAALAIIQVVIFNNMFTAIDQGVLSNAKEIVLSAISDPRAEVRQMASQVLSGLFHCNLISADQELLARFINCMSTGNPRRTKSSGGLSPREITIRHSGALGLCAYVNAHPYDVPDQMPNILIALIDHISDPQPVSSAIKECLRNFHRTHHDNWQEQKKKFTSDELMALTDVLVSPSYYA